MTDELTRAKRLVIEELAADYVEDAYQNTSDYFWRVARRGFKGFENMTPAELVEAAHDAGFFGSVSPSSPLSRALELLAAESVTLAAEGQG